MADTKAAAKLKRRRPVRRYLTALAIVIAPALVFPRWWCGREAPGFFEGRAAAQTALADEVARWVASGITCGDFETGSALFNGEWAFGTYQMAALGLSQVVLQHPEKTSDYVPVIEAAIERLLTPEIRAFDSNAWREDALETLDGENGHAACLGYMNLAIGLYRGAAPEPRFTELHERMTEALARRLAAAPVGIIETYPAESYPVDNAAVVASLALYDRATGADHSAAIESSLAAFRQRFMDKESGLLYQAVCEQSGTPFDKPRASGTALAAYFLSFADKELSRALYEALKSSCAADWLGFGLIREYPPNVVPGRGDIDSGPVVFGMSFSGTGFAIAPARIHGDSELYGRLYRTVHIVGAPLDSQGRRNFVCGGPLGNAIMLAMLTAGEMK